MKLLFASNSNFGLTILKEIISKRNGYSLSLITSSDKKMGRGKKYQSLQIKDFANRENIKTVECDDKESFIKKTHEISPDMIIVAGFGMIIPSPLLNSFNFINVHPSLLPKYRGATPIQQTILENELQTGVTIINVSEKIDEGPILAKKEVVLNEKINYQDAEEILAKEGGKLLLEKMDDIVKNKITPEKQDDTKATYTKTLTKEDGKINWNDSASFIERKVRAYNPWPGTYGKMGDNFFKVLEADIQRQTENGPFGEPGKIDLGTNNTIAVQTGKDFLLIKKLQIEGKKSTTSKDFLQGNMSSIGITLT